VSFFSRKGRSEQTSNESQASWIPFELLVATPFIRSYFADF